jgi:hypothetical protein
MKENKLFFSSTIFMDFIIKNHLINKHTNKHTNKLCE